MSPAILGAEGDQFIWKSNKTWYPVFGLATISKSDTLVSEIVLQSFAITSIMHFQIRVLAIALGLAPNWRFGIERTRRD